MYAHCLILVPWIKFQKNLQWLLVWKLSKAHKQYLRLKASMMKDSEKDVCLLLDEIHINHQISYQASRIEGTNPINFMPKPTSDVIFNN